MLSRTLLFNSLRRRIPSPAFKHCRLYTTDSTTFFKEKYDREKQEHLTLTKDAVGVDHSLLGRVTTLAKATHESKEFDHLGLNQPSEVFINNELNLSHIEVYGFDYDYTMANYTDQLSRTIYQILRDILIEQLRYPAGLRCLDFDPDFAIRGLHYDLQNGWLMKVDSFGNIQLNTVYVGREPIKNPDQIIQLHNGIHIPPHYLNTNMFQLNDLFSIPEACLLSDVLQYFKDHDTNFHPSYLYDDVRAAARILHSGSSRGGIGGLLHHRVMENVEQYLERSTKLVQYLENLTRNGKKLFLLTNSSFPFINRGLTYITGYPNWRDLFDAVIVLADKPNFYRSNRPFRRITEPTWAFVDGFHKEEVYQGGNLKDFSKFTGWYIDSGLKIQYELKTLPSDRKIGVGSDKNLISKYIPFGDVQKVMYIGDHIFSDLEEPNVQQGWRTGAIIRELETELQIRNTDSYRHTLSWLLRLERLIKQAQTANVEQRTPQLQHLLENWRDERKSIRRNLKTVFNKQFGSVFRTHHNPTCYTSNLENFDNYPLDYMFYPDRAYLPHERLVETLVDSGRIKGLI
ncbi:5' nucleotidase family-domain-containing protein [Endogone sp. FLAS-F59071]|nr:5' nucleotidase family-domain-containing protein [Endogone sp. FLAS-F59071]|eukprot:RUS21625.1 5' nucleotidase family-domain-containing protein [Endogone sp. FLAS-F59071]